MQLWSDEIDAMRDEAQQVVAAGMAAMAETFQAPGTPPTDRQARVQQFRDLTARRLLRGPGGRGQGDRRSAVPGVPV